MLEKLTDRGERIGAAAARAAAARIIARAGLPPDVRAEAVEEGIAISGRGLRHRLVRDERLRNFAR